MKRGSIKITEEALIKALSLGGLKANVVGVEFSPATATILIHFSAWSDDSPLPETPEGNVSMVVDKWSLNV